MIILWDIVVYQMLVEINYYNWKKVNILIFIIMKQFVASFSEGIGYSIGLNTPTFSISQAGTFKFNKLSCYEERCVGSNVNSVYETSNCAMNFIGGKYFFFIFFLFFFHYFDNN